jgi:hypothetical protein
MLVEVTVDAIPVKDGMATNGTPNEVVAPLTTGYVMHPAGMVLVCAKQRLAMNKKQMTTARFLSAVIFISNRGKETRSSRQKGFIDW